MENPLYKPCRKRWLTLRFGLGTAAFVLLTVFSVWLGVQVKWMRDRHEATQWISDRWAPGLSETTPTQAPWSIRLLGEPSGQRELMVEVHNDAERTVVEQLRRLFPEREVVINNMGRGDFYRPKGFPKLSD